MIKFIKRFWCRKFHREKWFKYNIDIHENDVYADCSCHICGSFFENERLGTQTELNVVEPKKDE